MHKVCMCKAHNRKAELCSMWHGSTGMGNGRVSHLVITRTWKLRVRKRSATIRACARLSLQRTVTLQSYTNSVMGKWRRAIVFALMGCTARSVW
jgi:hypothetical protein